MKVNGSLVFDASSASEIQNLRVQKTSDALPAFTAADAGRLLFKSDTGVLYVGVGATTNAWVALATGGNAAALQTEVDNIEAALGAGIDTNGDFVAGAFSGAANITAPSDFTDVLLQLDSAITGQDTLAELEDVTLGTLAAGDFLRYNGSVWADHTLVLADVTDVTATAAEVNLALDGITASAAELNVLDGVVGTTAADISSIAGFALEDVSATEFGYLDGVTSPIQAQLDGLQTEDATLTALASLNGTGIVVGDAVDSFVYRTMVAPSEGFTITNADGVAGNPTFALANDLAALEGLSTTGYIVRTGDGTATTRAITGTSGNIVVSNGSGVASDTSIDLAAVADSGSGSFLKITTDGFGRVTGTEAVVLADIEALAETTYVHTAGDTMEPGATLTFTGVGSKVVLPNLPTADTDAANKAYVDSIAAGLSWKQAVRAASTGNLTLASTTAVDGVNLVSGDRVLVKDQTASEENGIYTFDGTGLVRATDMDAAAEFAGATVFVTEGTANADSGWTQTAEVSTLDTDPVTWAQFSGSSTYTWGVGLQASGNTININVGAGITELPTDEVGIDLFDAATGALILTSTGTNRTTSSPAQLHLLLDAAGALAQGVDGLRIAANSVTNAMLVNEFIVLNSDSATPSNVDLGSTLEIIGTSVQGISTSHTGGVVTITASDASSSQKGVASFDATEFTVTSGNVVLGTVPVGKIATPTINFIGTDASADTVTLGESLTFASSVTGLVSAAVATNTITLDVRAATLSELGVASFDGSHFSVTAGAVSLAASIDDLTNVSGADAAADGDVLRFNGTAWTAESTSTLAGEIALGDLSDVSTGIVSEGQVLAVNGSGNWEERKIYHKQDFASATSWTVTHNLGAKYCVVTIVDASDEVVIPQSITFDSTTQLTVTFNTAIAGKVVVMGMLIGSGT